MDTLFEIVTSKYLYVPILVWFGIQSFKVIWDLVETKKFNFKRILGARRNAKFSFCCYNVFSYDGWKGRRV